MSEIYECLAASSVAVFGHRGAKAYAPMNTIPAFELAHEQGAHGIELDVQLSRDNQPVVIHDATVDATTDGSGAVAEMSLTELQALDAGAWFDESFTGTRIPTLSDVFAAVGTRLLVNVEIKSFTADETGIEKIVARSIEQHNMQGRVIVSSFNPLVLQRLSVIAPDLMLGLLLASETIDSVAGVLAPDVYAAQHLEADLVTPQRMQAATTHGHFVNVWTVNDADRARELASLGVHGIITDMPDVILKAIP